MEVPVVVYVQFDVPVKSHDQKKLGLFEKICLRRVRNR